MNYLQNCLASPLLQPIYWGLMVENVHNQIVFLITSANFKVQFNKHHQNISLKNTSEALEVKLSFSVVKITNQLVSICSLVKLIPSLRQFFGNTLYF